MNAKELELILQEHKEWLKDNTKGNRADLSGVDLRNANLIGADLSYTDLGSANLSYTDLSYANLRNADLSHTDLGSANLRGACLCGAELWYADLSYADLSGVNLSGANLENADLSYADLSYAYLRGANLKDADLSYANLSSAYLNDIDKCRLGIIIKEDTIGYKQLRDNIICKILVPKGAIVFSINNSKCRTNKCRVLENGGVSQKDETFIYEVGKEIEVDNFNLQYNVECGIGIHFFWTEEEARNYNY